ncbi:protein of unknown function DUF608 [Thermobaculum terrenum ATCC BAA-798]|uniref:Glucosylceramidase n=1 Tax=Thermobaculum terrenum (strain ATCC BAA-798 / CCMEE 7001 / YNP1) TaxID=525904 RepID=D1CHZ0_THET1|nr:GH116 family glycosyl-hydrolase [Thermobaculum terrenum]ACZ43361.1 protein of unknown function DUF608 [Thermobaculum terrenum ATCC BAA-798]
MSRYTREYGPEATALAFPLGGIGTGNVSLGARGDLRDWEICNRPAKGNRLPNTFFALWTRTASGRCVTRVLEGPIQPPHDGSHGYHPSTGAGLPRCRHSRFRGEYPLAWVELADPALPVRVSLEAYTPLIPLCPEDSGIPCAILSYTVENTSDEVVALTLVGSLTNPVGGVTFDRFGNYRGAGGNQNEYRESEVYRGLWLRSTTLPSDDLRYGDMTLATDHPVITYKRAWLRGAWWDYLREFWQDLSEDGRLEDLGYESPSEPGKTDTCSLGLRDELAPGETHTYRFVLTWYFPNRPHSWREEAGEIVRNHYASRFASSWDVAGYVFTHLARLEQGTKLFHDALFESTLPDCVLEALSANIVPLRSNTCFWLEDGRFLAWEGCFDDRGCCEGSCTHVWSYAHTLAFLFPSLEREMRRIEFEVETDERGWMAFRTYRTFGEQFVWPWGSQQPEAAADGQMGSILRVLREWRLSGDMEWLRRVWPGVKSALAYASAQWDGDGDGVLDGRQHNTYDVEFYGPNPLCGLYYLAALRAVEELAEVLGEANLARRCREVFERGSHRLDELLWNGEYYEQLGDEDAWPYQHGKGCLADQLLGQLQAHVLGMGYLVPEEHVRQALRSIWRYNFRADLSEHVNCQRTFALNDEAGLLMCTWPRGGQPTFPFPYSDEVFTGSEYQVAAHMIYEGLLEEGLQIVGAVRGRHDGRRRNPWDEVECGHHYARSMASWALLLALSGFTCDVARREMTFRPVTAASAEEGVFTCFWSTGLGWGTYTQRLDAETGQWVPEVKVLWGDLRGVRVRACGKEWTLS